MTDANFWEHETSFPVQSALRSLRELQKLIFPEVSGLAVFEDGEMRASDGEHAIVEDRKCSFDSHLRSDQLQCTSL